MMLLGKFYGKLSVDKMSFLYRYYVTKPVLATKSRFPFASFGLALLFLGQQVSTTIRGVTERA
jgi:hypothetical protein